MSESTDRAPQADDTVDEVAAPPDEQAVEEDARSLPQVGRDDDPGSMMNL